MKNCDRCTAPMTLPTVSRFNTEEICVVCQQREVAHPKYKEACDTKLAQGIGCPDELRLPCPASTFVQIYGLEKIRGVPLQDGDKVVYASDTALDSEIALWGDEDDDTFRMRMESKSRLYGAEERNANMVSWIYLNKVTLPLGVTHA